MCGFTEHKWKHQKPMQDEPLKYDPSSTFKLHVFVQGTISIHFSSFQSKKQIRGK